MNTFEEQYKDRIECIDNYISNYFDSIKNVEDNLHSSLYYAVLNGGKRLRSILCMETAMAFGAKIQNVYPFATALEFIHAYSLVHDDLPGMDNSLTRRDKPSCFAKYGVGPAILTGDALLNLAFEVMINECIESVELVQNKMNAMKTIAECSGIHGMINGQAIDLKIADNPSTDERTLITLIEHKTMALIKASVISGAELAGCDKNTVSLLNEFAYNLGLAFQIRDDFEDEEEDKSLAQDSPNFINVLGRDNAKKQLEITSLKAYNILCGIEEFKSNDFLKRFIEFLFGIKQ